MQYTTLFSWRISSLFIALALSSCGGGGGGDGGSVPSAAISSTATVSGTVPGTLIEAFGDNGSYYRTTSRDDGSLKHPFSLELPAGVGLRLVMTTGKGNAEEVVSPLGFRDNRMRVHTRLMLGAGDHVDIGHVPLAMSRAEAAGDVDGDGDMDDVDLDGVLDSPFMLDDAHSPLAQANADGDELNDYDDPDHGGYRYSGKDMDPLDHDGDGVPNMYDPHYTPPAGFSDADHDGLHDKTDDVNPTNVAGKNTRFSDDKDGDGYHDDDMNRDGFQDGDLDRDGFMDDDMPDRDMHDDR